GQADDEDERMLDLAVDVERLLGRLEPLVELAKEPFVADILGVCGRSGSRDLVERPGHAGTGTTRAASISEPRISEPSVDPRSGSTACSGCGIRPMTFPRSETTPAMSSTAPFGFSPGS